MELRLSVNDVIADKNVVTKIMNNSTGLQRIELNGFSKTSLANWLLPLCIWLVFRPVLRPRLVPVFYRFGVLTDGDDNNEVNDNDDGIKIVKKPINIRILQ